MEGWKHTRVRQTPTGWWSDINPAAQRLARDTILASSTTAQAWDRLKDAPFPIHLWVAGWISRQALMWACRHASCAAVAVCEPDLGCGQHQTR